MAIVKGVMQFSNLIVRPGNTAGECHFVADVELADAPEPPPPPPTGNLPIPDGDTRALFFKMVEGKPFGQQTLLDLEPELRRYCIQLTPPNAAGERTKIGDPISKRWTRVGFGEGHWVWIPQNDIYQPIC